MRKNETTGSEMALAPSDIRPLIHELRGVQVMLDRDLAELYQVPTKVLNQAVKRNASRFPSEYCFRLTDVEMDELVTNCDRFATLKHFTKTLCGICHDRFIVVVQKEIFWTGASLKDAGRLTFAAAKMGDEMIPGLLASIRKATSASKDYSKGR